MQTQGWRMWSPRYLKTIVDATRQDRLVVSGASIATAQARELLKAHAIHGMHIEFGNVIAHCSIEDLLLHKSIQEIRNWVLLQRRRSGASNLLLQAMEKLFLQRKPDAAYRLLDSCVQTNRFGTIPVLLWMLYFHEPLRARKILEFNENRFSTCKQWIQAALLWRSLFADEDRVNRSLSCALETAESIGDKIRVTECLLLLDEPPLRIERQFEAALSLSDSCQNLAKVGLAWRRLFDNDNKALDCLRQAEEQAKEASDWLSCAQGWILTFQGKHHAEQCLLNATELVADIKEKNSELTHTRLEVAYHWLHMLCDVDRTRQQLHDVMERQATASQWIESANLWHELRTVDAQSGQECESQIEKALQHASEHANALHDRWAIVQTWKKCSGDPMLLKKCFAHAEKSGCNCPEMTWVAWLWKEFLDDTSSTRRCLKKAEELSCEANEWHMVAESWQELLGADKETARCLDQAEKKGRGVSFLLSLLKDWDTVTEGGERKRRCITLACRMATRCSDWVLLSKAFSGWLNDMDQANECLRRAQDNADCVSDWLDIAREWNKIDEIGFHCRFALESADRLATAFSEKLDVLVMRKELLKDNETLISGLKYLMRSACQTDDWLALERMFREHTKHTKETLHCWRKAVIVAESTQDWLNIAMVYSEYLTVAHLFHDAEKTLKTSLVMAANLAETENERRRVDRTWRRLIGGDMLR